MDACKIFEDCVEGNGSVFPAFVVGDLDQWLHFTFCLFPARIDYNIEQVAQQVEAGVSELEKAEKKQKASRSILCIAALIVCILIVLLVIVYRVS